MSILKFQATFYVIIGLCIFTMILSFTSFDFIEIDTAIIWTMKYFAFPILFIVTPSCYLTYLNFIQQHETKEYESKIWMQLRTIFRTFIMAIAMTGIFIGTTISLIILTNAYIGDSKKIKLKAQIIDYYTLKSKGQTRHYIKIKEQQLDRVITLKVQEQYQIRQTFNKTMLIGKWGLLYSNK